MLRLGRRATGFACALFSAAIAGIGIGPSPASAGVPADPAAVDVAEARTTGLKVRTSGGRKAYACASRQGGAIRSIRVAGGNRAVGRIRCRAGEVRLSWRARGRPSVIQGCVRRRTGAVRIVRVGSGRYRCRRKESKISWSITGPAGPRGDQGPQGPPGNNGKDGAPGVIDKPGYRQTTVLSGIEQADRPAVAIGTDGNPMIVVGDGGGLHVVHCSDIACTGSTSSILSTSYTTTAADVVIGSDGYPLIMAIANGDVWATHCLNLSCTSAESTRLLDLQNTGDVDISVALASSGNAIFSFYDASAGDLSFGRCANVACASLSDRTVVDASGTTGSYNSLVVGSSGLPFIAYYSGSSSSLKTAACANVMCTVSTITTIDNSADTGQGVSAALGVDGMVVMSYAAGAAQNVARVAHCSNAACSAATTLDVGTYSSPTLARSSTDILVAYDGRPIVFARQPGTTELLPRHCSDVACTSYTSGVDNLGLGGFSDAVNGVDGLPFVVTNAHDAGPYYVLATHCSSTYCIPYH